MARKKSSRTWAGCYLQRRPEPVVARSTGRDVLPPGYSTLRGTLSSKIWLFGTLTTLLSTVRMSNIDIIATKHRYKQKHCRTRLPQRVLHPGDIRAVTHIPSLTAHNVFFVFLSTPKRSEDKQSSKINATGTLVTSFEHGIVPRMSSSFHSHAGILVVWQSANTPTSFSTSTTRLSDDKKVRLIQVDITPSNTPALFGSCSISAPRRQIHRLAHRRHK